MSFPLFLHINKSQLTMEDDDDIIITGGTLGVAALAPHHRYYGCPENKPLVDPSTRKPTASDALKFCRLCVCYVCDTPASQCAQWHDHCEAAPAGYARPGGRDWVAMKRQVCVWCYVCMMRVYSNTFQATRRYGPMRSGYVRMRRG